MSLNFGRRAVFQRDESAGFRGMSATFADVSDQSAHDFAGGEFFVAGAQAQDQAIAVYAAHEAPRDLVKAKQEVGDLW